MEIIKTMRVAVASSGKGKIDIHFGQAEDFLVFDLLADVPSFVEKRIINDYYRSGEGEDDKRDVILRVLSDCQALFLARVGDGPRKKLVNAGIVPVDEFSGEAIESSILGWLAKAAPVHLA